ncbi:MAG: tetratricopeptide repeat protein [Phycisphaeraceae bacterium]|nr:MAG: tetratricopeptide repeat protein [Phycisphaeraceae bacterium]
MSTQHPESMIGGLPRRAGLVFLAAATLLSGCATREKALLDARLLGDQAMLEDRYADAAAEYEAYLEERPGRHEVLYKLGRAYEGMGEHSAAREAFGVAYELQPDNPEYIEALARTMAENGEADGAFDMLERIAAESQRSDAYLRLGGFLLDQGLADEAVQAMTIAAHLQPSAEPYQALAGAYQRFGDAEREIEALRHVLWFDPADQASANRVRALGQIPGPTFAAPPADEG